MRRIAKWFAWIVAGLIGVPASVVAVIIVAANTGPGRHLIERVTPWLSADTVRLAGISGRFPDALRIARVALRDPQGDYATIEAMALDWSPLQLLHRRVVIDRLGAARLDVIRTPAGKSSGGFTLPAPVHVRALHVARVDVSAAIAGTQASVELSGSGEAVTPTDFGVVLDVRQIAGPGRYGLRLNSDQGLVEGTVKASDSEHGLLAGLTGLPDIGAIALDASLRGPRTAIAVQLTLAAGPLQATAHGTIDLKGEAVDLVVSAAAPAMRPRPELSWQSVTLDTHVRGPFTRPDADGQLRIEAPAFGGAMASSVSADIAGNAGRIRLSGVVAGLRVPMADPTLFAGDPLTIEADGRLDAPDRPIHIMLRHRLFNLMADAQTGEQRSLDATVNVPDLLPFAAMEKVDLAGSTAVSLHAKTLADNTTTFAARGTIGVIGRQQQARALVGENGQFTLAGALSGSDLTLSELGFSGQSMAVSAHGSVGADRVDIGWSVKVNDLAAAYPSLGGELQANGRISGSQHSLDLVGDISGGVAVHGMSSGAVSAHVAVSGLPYSPAGRITAQGALLNAPIELAVAMRRTSDGLAIEIERASWNTLRASGALKMPTATMVPAGEFSVAMDRLADLAPLVGRPLSGSLNAVLQASPDKAHVAVRVDRAALAGAAVSRIALTADIDQPESHPLLDARLDAQGIEAKGVVGSVQATANGPVNAVKVTLSASLPELFGASGQLNTVAIVDVLARSVSVASLQGEWHQQTVRLLAPVRVSFGNGVTIDRLRLGLRQAVVEVSGRVDTTLDITASLRNLPADIAAVVSPAYAADGIVEADARITGTPGRLSGRLRVTANGLRARNGPARAMPAANITAVATLDGPGALIDARIVAGRSHLTLTGRAPLAATGSLGLRADGLLDLAVADPVLAAGGRRVRGQVTLHLVIAGRPDAPDVSGSAELTGGEVQDYASGVHLNDIAAQVQGSGATLHIVRLSAKAGSGTIDISGSVGAMAPGLPVDLALTAHNARPLASDLISAALDANLTVRGEALGQLAVSGDVHVQRADIRIPERLPTSIAVLPVRQEGIKPPLPAPATTSVIMLDLTIAAPQQVFVRGRGLAAEFGGKMKLTGTSSAPRSAGALHLRRGTLNLAGRTLDFTEGEIAFNGGSLTDPSLHLVATSTNGNVVATLTIEGTAQKPKISLTSVPALPQDEVLAHLLFGSSVGRLGALDVAQIAAGLATLTGAGGGIGDPLDKVRQDLGLDRLSVGSSSSGGATLEAGRYVAPGIFLGAKQGTAGTGTQASVQVDITKGLKLTATAGTGGDRATGTAPSESNGSSIGLSYQFQY